MIISIVSFLVYAVAAYILFVLALSVIFTPLWIYTEIREWISRSDSAFLTSASSLLRKRKAYPLLRAEVD